MSEISRIGSTGAVSRDTPSNGLDAIGKAENRQAAGVVPDNRPRNPAVDQVSKLYEKQFLGEMLKAMRSTIKHTEEPSMAENIYNDQLDQQYVDSWGENGGIGLSKIIYEQIMARYFGEGSGRELKKQGPVALTDRDISHVTRIPSTSPGQNPVESQIPLKVELKPSSTGQPAQIQSPWDAQIVSRGLVDGKTTLTLDHGGGLRSTLMFNGVATADAQPGERIERGKTIGLLSPEERTFLWNLNPGK